MEAKITTLHKPGRYPKFPPNSRPWSILSTTGKLFHGVVIKILRRHIKDRNLLNACRLGFHTRRSTTLHCRKLTDAIFLDTENAHGVLACVVYKNYKILSPNN
jgi:hypothetical protein